VFAAATERKLGNVIVHLKNCVSMKNRIITIFFLIFSLFSFSQEEDELYLNYLFAARNGGTFQINLVIKYKDVSTSETREICIEGEQLMLAFWKENNLVFGDNDSFDKYYKMLLDNKSRYFEFKNPKALESITVDYYTENELKEMEKKVDFDKLARKIKKSKKWEESFDSKTLKIYAHALFNRGILTGQNNCFGGETLEYVERTHCN
jgi:hypothetical protein